MKYVVIMDAAEFAEHAGFSETELTCRAFVPLRGHVVREHSLALKPIKRPCFITEGGDVLYLTDGHVKALIDYETNEAIKKFVNGGNENAGIN